jgi:predicted nucleotidyltransferase
MSKENIKHIIHSLNKSGLKYLIVGGFAVIAHGYVRYTADLDIVIAIDTDNIDRLIQVMDKLGYQPRLPVQISDMLVDEKRQEWIEEKNMVVFSLISEQYKLIPIDIFIREPFNFEEELEHAEWIKLGEGLKAPFVRIEQLIQMKKESGREKDTLDLEKLMEIMKLNHERRDKR